MWLSITDLAGLPGLPTSGRATRTWLARYGVPSRTRPGRGGGLEYDASALPPDARAALLARQVAAAAPVIDFAPPPPVPLTAPPVPAPAPPPRRPASDADKAVADARVTLVRLVEDLAPLHGAQRAYALVAAELAAGRLAEPLQAAARLANQRARGTPLSARTLQRWCGQYQADGWWGLLPAPQQPQPLARIDDDVAAVLGLYHSRDPQWRNLTRAAMQVTRQLGRPLDDWRALYGRARRALAKVDNVGLIKSRHSGAQRAALLPFKRRDTSVLAPLDVWVIDGHTFKAKVRHPDHGAPFAPELTLVLDAATRRVMGWSVALSENVLAVGDALRHAIGQHGVPAIVYSDNGAGETAKVMDCPIDGFMARLGIDHRTGIPGHPQGHGIIERSWRTHAINCARQFGSYQGGDVDAGTFRKAAAELAREQRALRRAEQALQVGEPAQVVRLSDKAPSWQQFVDAVERMVADYNGTHRHRALPKRADGKHQTPDEAWAAMLRPELQHKPDAAELRQLFMPAVLRTARRGEVVLFNQHYQASELMGMEVDGRQVSVRYDVHDASYVEVFTLDGRPVCRAQWNANRIDYFPKAQVLRARERRKDAAVKRLMQKIDTATREVRPTLDAQTVFLPAPTAPELLVPIVEGGRYDSTLLDALPSTGEVARGAATAADATSGRPFIFDAPSDRYEWLMRHRGSWLDDDGPWLEQYAASDDYASLREYYEGRGLGWRAGGAADGFKGAQVLVAANT